MSSMTRDELKARFPNASAAFVAANCVDDHGQASIMERGIGHEPLAKTQAQKRDSATFQVSVLSIRKRLLDEDNLCEKFHVDCLRRFGFIPNDDPATTHIEVTQRKCERGEPERVQITIRQSDKAYDGERDSKMCGE